MLLKLRRAILCATLLGPSIRGTGPWAGQPSGTKAHVCAVGCNDGSVKPPLACPAAERGAVGRRGGRQQIPRPGPGQRPCTGPARRGHSTVTGRRETRHSFTLTRHSGTRGQESHCALTLSPGSSSSLALPYPVYTPSSLFHFPLSYYPL